jgi:ParB-like chromosome segregation protein Spo0J
MLTRSDPIDRIQWVEASTLVANFYNPNVVHYQELALLEHSIERTGWIQPILINPDRVIIDGFHRWSLALRSERLMRLYAGQVPVAIIPVDLPGAMMMTIRINRAKGTHVALKMSEIVHTLLNEHKLDKQQIAAEIGANLDEVELLAQDGIFQARDLKNVPFSKSWVPKDSFSRKEMAARGPHPKQFAKK